MRATTLLTEILGLKETKVLGLEFVPDGLVVEVKPRQRRARCSGCTRKVRGLYDRRDGRRWRHLSLAGLDVWVRYDVRRVECPRCGVRVELVPWAERESDFTVPFEEMTAYLAQRTDQTTVSGMMRVAWTTVGSIVARVIARLGPTDRLEGLRCIGVDELSYRRHHEYVTVVVDHRSGNVVWVGEGKSADTLKQFFAALGAERAALLEAVTIDLSGAYIKAVTEASPAALLVFDRFHVQRLAHEAVDEVRRSEARALSIAEDRRLLKGIRFALQKNPWNLLRSERIKLTQLQRENRRIYRAYLLKESLLDILDRHQVGVAARKLDEWCRWAMRSQLRPFKKLARTLRKHKDGVLAYVQTRLNNGRTEGLNGKIRVITRRAFGFHNVSSLIGMIFLCCSGLRLSPLHRTPSPPLLNPQLT
jgi:transposase